MQSMMPSYLILSEIQGKITRALNPGHSDLQTRGPNGPDIAHLGILPQFGQNSFSGY